MINTINMIVEAKLKTILNQSIMNLSYHVGELSFFEKFCLIIKINSFLFPLYDYSDERIANIH